MVAYSFVLAAAAAITVVGAMPTQPYANSGSSYGEQSSGSSSDSYNKPAPINNYVHQSSSYSLPSASAYNYASQSTGSSYRPAPVDNSGSSYESGQSSGSYNQPPAGGSYQPSQPPAQPPAQPPTGTYNAYPNRATHRVLAGFNGLHFEPENIVAEIGDLIEVHFNPMNHSFAQSSFDNPCMPINDDAIFSGFQPTQGKEAPNAFTFEVKDKNPFWFYCSQTKGSHCQMGMAGAINQDFNSDKTLANYKLKAATTGMSVSPPKPGNGGTLAPPPNGPGL